MRELLSLLALLLLLASILAADTDCLDGRRFVVKLDKKGIRTYEDTAECCEGFALSAKKICEPTPEKCQDGYYGIFCEKTCKICDDACHRITGVCLDFRYDFLTSPLADGRLGVAFGALLVLALIVALLSMLVAYKFYYRRRGEHRAEECQRIAHSEFTDALP